MTTATDLNTNCPMTFCPGCGNFGIWGALKNAAIQENWNNSNTVLVAGIGCHGHMVNFLRLNAFEGLHGRAIPVATGIKLVNHKLNVVVLTGDGDALAEGGNHFLHACRRNHDLTVLLHDNSIYGLTTGQTSPTSPDGFRSKSTPLGNPDHPLHPLSLAIAAGASFVARSFAGDILHLTETIIAATRHQGFSVVDILQPCITFNKEYTVDFYRQNIYHLDNNYNPSDKHAAFAKSLEWGPGQIPVGIIYQENRPSFESALPQLRDQPLIALEPSVKNISALYKKYQ